jgi:nucleobase:cation symporter-1, NCS1 family
MSSLSNENAAGVTGRLPSLESERSFSCYRSLTFTQISLTAAIWTVLVGGMVPSAGNTLLAIIGYTCGAVLGMTPVLLGSALPSFRYGVDVIELSKAVLGVRGSALALAGFLVMSLGGAAVAFAMICRGIGMMPAHAGRIGIAASEQSVVFVGCITLVLMYVLLRRGLDTVQRINNIVGPIFVLFITASLLLLLWKCGLRTLVLTNVPAGQALTHDPRRAFIYALEFGATVSLSWYPYLGGMYRTVKHRRHTVGPCMIGGVLVGGGLTVVVSAMAAVQFGTADPAIWFIQLTGPIIGSVVVSIVLLVSISAIGMTVYLAAVGAQQINVLARMPWSWLLALMLVPLPLAVVNTSWVLAHVMTIATFGGLIFFGLSGVMVVDFWILRRQFIALEHLFVADNSGCYWFWGGVNWVAIAVIAASSAIYLRIYDPITLRSADAFQFFGAVLPVVVGSGALYYVLAKLIVIPSGRGGYHACRIRSAGEGIARVGL